MLITWDVISHLLPSNFVFLTQILKWNQKKKLYDPSIIIHKMILCGM